jgi:hypothetical protein
MFRVQRLENAEYGPTKIWRDVPGSVHQSQFEASEDRSFGRFRNLHMTNSTVRNHNFGRKANHV